MSDQRYELQPIGWVESPLVDRAAAPRQGNEGSPEAWRVRIFAIQGTKVRVGDLEALDRMPIVDLKPVLDRRVER